MYQSVYVHVHVHVCTCMYVRMYVCMYVRMYVHVCMYVHMYVCMYVCTCMYVCMYLFSVVLHVHVVSFLRFSLKFEMQYNEESFTLLKLLCVTVSTLVVNQKWQNPIASTHVQYF